MPGLERGRLGGDLLFHRQPRVSGNQIDPDSEIDQRRLGAVDQGKAVLERGVDGAADELLVFDAQQHGLRHRDFLARLGQRRHAGPFDLRDVAVPAPPPGDETGRGERQQRCERANPAPWQGALVPGRFAPRGGGGRSGSIAGRRRDGLRANWCRLVRPGIDWRFERRTLDRRRSRLLRRRGGSPGRRPRRGPRGAGLVLRPWHCRTSARRCGGCRARRRCRVPGLVLGRIRRRIRRRRRRRRGRVDRARPDLDATARVGRALRLRRGARRRCRREREIAGRLGLRQRGNRGGERNQGKTDTQDHGASVQRESPPMREAALNRH